MEILNGTMKCLMTLHKTDCNKVVIDIDRIESVQEVEVGNDKVLAVKMMSGETYFTEEILKEFINRMMRVANGGVDP